MAAGKHVLYFALLPPPDVAKAAHELLATLKPRPSARPTAAGRLHVSLNGLGSFQRPPGPVIEKAIEVAAEVRAPRFAVALNRVSAWSRGDKPCVAAWGDEGVIGVNQLHATIHDALARRGMVPRRLTEIFPHMTLVYDPAKVPETPVEPLTWRVGEFVLIHAVHGEGGFDVAARFPLG
jgi:2'-5' RNA ligase